MYLTYHIYLFKNTATVLVFLQCGIYRRHCQSNSYLVTEGKEFFMIQSIHYSKLLTKHLQRLRKTGKKAELAASKCDAILNDIRLHGCQCEAVLGKRTRCGELRIRNCVKYHLGSGYRLVTIRAHCHLFICFVGSHEETNQWIENHRLIELAPGNPLFRCEERVSP